MSAPAGRRLRAHRPRPRRPRPGRRLPRHHGHAGLALRGGARGPDLPGPPGDHRRRARHAVRPRHRRRGLDRQPRRRAARGRPAVRPVHHRPVHRHAHRSGREARVRGHVRGLPRPPRPGPLRPQRAPDDRGRRGPADPALPRRPRRPHLYPRGPPARRPASRAAAGRAPGHHRQRPLRLRPRRRPVRPRPFRPRRGLRRRRLHRRPPRHHGHQLRRLLHHRGRQRGRRLRRRARPLRPLHPDQQPRPGLRAHQRRQLQLPDRGDRELRRHRLRRGLPAARRSRRASLGLPAHQRLARLGARQLPGLRRARLPHRVALGRLAQLQQQRPHPAAPGLQLERRLPLARVRPLVRPRDRQLGALRLLQRHLRSQLPHRLRPLLLVPGEPDHRLARGLGPVPLLGRGRLVPRPLRPGSPRPGVGRDPGPVLRAGHLLRRPPAHRGLHRRGDPGHRRRRPGQPRRLRQLHRPPGRRRGHRLHPQRRGQPHRIAGLPRQVRRPLSRPARAVLGDRGQLRVHARRRAPRGGRQPGLAHPSHRRGVGQPPRDPDLDPGAGRHVRHRRLRPLHHHRRPGHAQHHAGHRRCHHLRHRPAAAGQLLLQHPRRRSCRALERIVRLVRSLPDPRARSRRPRPLADHRLGLPAGAAQHRRHGDRRLHRLPRAAGRRPGHLVEPRRSQRGRGQHRRGLLRLAQPRWRPHRHRLLERHRAGHRLLGSQPRPRLGAGRPPQLHLPP